MPPGELLFHLNGDSLHPVPVYQGIPHNFYFFHLHGLPDGLCLQGMMQDSVGHRGLGFGVFILQHGCGVEGGHLLHDDRELDVGGICHGPDHGLHLHLGTVLTQNGPGNVEGHVLVDVAEGRNLLEIVVTLLV